MAALGRIAFLGTGAFGIPLLRRIAEDRAGTEIMVLSQPDRPAGRGMQLRASPVAALGRELGLPVHTPERLRSPEAHEILAGFAPDGLLLVAHGQLVPASILAMAPRPPLNVHPSLLPRHRGAAPVASTILSGDPEAGLTLMVMVEQLDAGPIVAQWRLPLTGREETPELRARLAELAAEVVPPELDQWASGAIDPQPQDEREATMIRPFTRRDGWIDWRRDAEEIDRQVRALQPWPGAWTTLDGRRLHVRRARPLAGISDVPIGAILPGLPPRVACGIGALELDIVQPEGGRAMPADAWRNGLQRDHILLGTVPPG